MNIELYKSKHTDGTVYLYLVEEPRVIMMFEEVSSREVFYHPIDHVRPRWFNNSFKIELGYLQKFHNFFDEFFNGEIL